MINNKNVTYEQINPSVTVKHKSQITHHLYDLRKLDTEIILEKQQITSLTDTWKKKDKLKL